MLLNSKTLMDKAWGIYRKRFKIFFGIMIMPVIFSFLLGLFIALGTKLLHSDSAFFGALGVAALVFSAVLSLGGIIIQLWSQTALLYAIKDREENIGIKESYRRGWNKIISYFWISLLSGLVISGGFFLFFVPGLIFLIWFSLSVFVFASENKKGWSALTASREYIRGNWWAVFWRLLLIGILSWLVLFVLGLLVGFLLTSANEKVYFYIGYILLVPMVTVYSFLIYENLRKTKISDHDALNIESKNK